MEHILSTVAGIALAIGVTAAVAICTLFPIAWAVTAGRK